MTFLVLMSLTLFLNSVYQVYRPGKENKIQGYVEIINQQRGEIILEDTKV